MIKITTQPHADEIRILIEGRVSSPFHNDLRHPIERALASGLPVVLDLSAVRFADRAGAGLIHGFVRAGVRLGPCSGFMREILRTLDDGPRGPASDGRGRSDDDPEEDQWLDRLKRGDAAAFDWLVTSYRPAMLIAARRIVGEQEAEDAVQDALLAAFKGIGGFCGTARLSTWLHRIAVTSALMILRRRRARPEISADPVEWSADSDFGASDGRLACERALDEQLDVRSRCAAVRRLIDDLPESYRSVLVLRDLDGLSTLDAARSLGCTANAVKIRLYRARRALGALAEPQFNVAV